MYSCVSRRQAIWVAYLVQRAALRGKGIPVTLSRQEDFPDDWSPNAASCNSCQYETRERRGHGVSHLWKRNVNA